MTKYQSSNDVLNNWTGRDDSPDPKTVWRYFLQYRRTAGLEPQCDNDGCPCAHSPTLWNDKPLKVQLDHVDGNPADHSPGNLRFLCPNCHSQTATYAGRNKGNVVIISETEYLVHCENGTKYTFKATGGGAAGGKALVELTKEESVD